MTMFRVFYMRPDYFRNGICGDTPTIAKLSETHAELRTVEAEGLEALFSLQQAHNWAEDWQACNALLDSKGLGHTSMSVGDVAENTETGEYFVVAFAGFKRLDE